MSLEELARVIPPPDQPCETGNRAKRTAFERRVGIHLPKDYWDVVSTYGTGMFADHILIYSPFTTCKNLSFLRECKFCCGVLKDHKENFDDPDEPQFPFAVFPDRPGLLPFGRDEYCNYYHWLTVGRPERWPIILTNRTLDEYQRFDMPLTTFLAKVLSKKKKCKHWSPDFPQVEDRIFVPFDPKTGKMRKPKTPNQRERKFSQGNQERSCPFNIW